MTSPSPSSSPSSATRARLPREPARASVYVHFPWCLEKCPYCDFTSYKTERASIDHRGYADAVLAELTSRATSFGLGHRLGSIFFGGGTPSLWEPRELGRVLAAVRRVFDCAPDFEATVECNPTSLDEGRARALVDQGVNRLSIGVQALRDGELSFLGRLHNAEGGVTAVREAIDAGVPRVSADLIFGLPGQTPEAARDEANALADLGLQHLSCYQLTIEPGTRFGDLARKGRLPLADDGRVAEGFLAIDEALSARGFGHYEISNYAKPGEEARHNLGYWRGEEYLGLGCAAYGMVRCAAGTGAVRYRNTADPARYVESALTLRDLPADASHVSVSEEPLDAEALLRERIMLGLRIAVGIDLAAMGADLGVDPFTAERGRAVERLVSRGRLEREGSRLKVPRAAWLFTDDTAARLF